MSKITDLGAALDPQFERVEMSDKLRAAALAALEWLKDKRLDTWEYMEGSQFYSDRHKQAKALEAALAETTVKESLIAQRPWVGLTGDEIEDLNKDQTLWEIIRAAEEILKEKNT